ncbi:13850_t:CDS:10 [Ambispora leptoticha]|uniref:13850_t:CDS:1 n=1 Tax=Ambispora leptoticha TaxID=144679 RepID=A0A9N8V895_9GLOM|nr:13850_t:CDS:10 [Ambispora leptoticha]
MADHTFYVDFYNDIPSTYVEDGALLTFGLYMKYPKAPGLNNIAWLKADVPEKGMAGVSFKKEYSVISAYYNDEDQIGVYNSRQIFKTELGKEWTLTKYRKIAQFEKTTTYSGNPNVISIQNKSGNLAHLGIGIDGRLACVKPVYDGAKTAFKVNETYFVGVFNELVEGQVITGLQIQLILDLSIIVRKLLQHLTVKLLSYQSPIRTSCLQAFNVITFAVFQEKPTPRRLVWLQADVPENGTASIAFEEVYDVVAINYDDPEGSGVYQSQQKRRTKPGATWESKIKDNIQQLFLTSKEAPDGQIHIINNTGLKSDFGLAMSGSIIQHRNGVPPGEVAKFDLKLEATLGVLSNRNAGQIITFDIVDIDIKYASRHGIPSIDRNSNSRL